MPVKLSEGAAIPNIYPGSPAATTPKQKEAVYNVIGQLQYNEIFKSSAGTIHDNKVMRLDMQSTFKKGTETFHNLQVQVDGIKGRSTVAHANVSESTMTDDKPNQKGVLKKVISALNQSFDKGKSYEVTGTAP